MVLSKNNDNGVVKIGFIEDYSGDLAIYGIQKLHAAQLAVKEINEGFCLAGGLIGAPGIGVLGKSSLVAPKLSCKGDELIYNNEVTEPNDKKVFFSEEDKILIRSGDKGLLGKEVQLFAPDGESNLRRWSYLARRLIQKDNIDVLVAGFSSSSRETIRPIVREFNQLYIYTNQYEGGVADKNTFCTGAVCEQQVIPIIDYMVKTYGSRLYIVAADYNFGRLTAAWTKASARRVSANIVGEEFVPLGTSQFGAIISRIRETKPDWVMTLIIGAAQQNYYPQAAAEGLCYPMASTVNMAQGYEHVRFSPPVMANLHNAVNYMMEIPTIRNRAFVKRWYRMFPTDPYIGQMAQNTYFSIHLYANAVRMSGTTDQIEVRRALESGIHIEAPEGTVFMEPSTHHAAHHIRLARCDEEHKITFVQEWPSIGAWWLQRLGVNLVGKPEYKQYTPSDDPIFNKYPIK
jgi:urea transport system substrate-binding protein